MSARGWIGLGITGATLALALLSLAWTPWPTDALDIAHRLAPATFAHPLGTDQLGRDLVSLLMAGGLPAFATAALALAIGVGVGIPLGLAAAASPGWVDEAIARVADILFGFPALILAMLIVAVFGPGVAHAALAIGIFNIPVFVRVTRSAARGLWARDFILAARLAGRSGTRISIEHVLPNIAGGLIVQATIQFAIGLTAETGLAYLGLGAQPPQPSWGRMLADGQSLVAIAPRLVLLPGCALLLVIVAVNLLATALAERRR